MLLLQRGKIKYGGRIDVYYCFYDTGFGDINGKI